MDKLKDLSKQFDAQASKYLGPIDNNVYLSSAISLFVVLYACSVAPRLPNPIGWVLRNPLGKIAFFFLIAYMFQKNPSAAAVSAVGLVVVMSLLSRMSRTSYLPSMPSMPSMTYGKGGQRYEAIDDKSVIVAEAGSAGLIPTEDLSELDGESCASKNSFYPQYANMKTDSYVARDNISNVSGYDPTAAYSSI